MKYEVVPTALPFVHMKDLVELPESEWRKYHPFDEVESEELPAEQLEFLLKTGALRPSDSQNEVTSDPKEA